MPSLELPPGTLVDRFRIHRSLGKGGMGVVYLAEDEGGEPVALKFLSRSGTRPRQRFEREIETGMLLRHPNVVQVLDYGSHAGVRYLVMEYFRGRNLQEVIEEVGRLHPRVVLRLARQLSRGLTAFHEQGIVHRDVKPANLMVTPEAELMIADLGLVRDPEVEGLTRAGVLVGTPWYMAPEQIRGETPSPALDVFAMTVCVYVMLTGHHPLRRAGENQPLQYLARLPVAVPRPWHPSAADGPLDRVFRRGMSRDPGDRHESVRALARALYQAFRAEKVRGRSVQETQGMARVEPESPLDPAG